MAVHFSSQKKANFPIICFLAYPPSLIPLSSDDCTTMDSTNPGEHFIMRASYEDSLAPYAPAGLGVKIICPHPTAHVGHVSNISDVVINDRGLMFNLF
jgi:hypothetical protein